MLKPSEVLPLEQARIKALIADYHHHLPVYLE